MGRIVHLIGKHGVGKTTLCIFAANQTNSDWFSLGAYVRTFNRGGTDTRVTRHIANNLPRPTSSLTLAPQIVGQIAQCLRNASALTFADGLLRTEEDLPYLLGDTDVVWQLQAEQQTITQRLDGRLGRKALNHEQPSARDQSLGALITTLGSRLECIDANRSVPQVVVMAILLARRQGLFVGTNNEAGSPT